MNGITLIDAFTKPHLEDGVRLLLDAKRRRPADRVTHPVTVKFTSAELAQLELLRRELGDFRKRRESRSDVVRRLIVAAAAGSTGQLGKVGGAP